MKYAAVFLLGLAPVAIFGQSSADPSFKGNNLGMSLEQFKQQNAGDPVWVVFRDPNQKNRRVKKQLPTPVCTDTNDGAFSFRGFYDYPLADWNRLEILCDVSPGLTNEYGKEVANQQMSSILYRFYSERLYRIDLKFSPAVYQTIASAFREKYGEPSKSTGLQFQNTFGASWKGEVLVWKWESKVILLSEGPGSGPGQQGFDQHNSAEAMFFDFALQPPAEKPDVSDF